MSNARSNPLFPNTIKSCWIFLCSYFPDSARFGKSGFSLKREENRSNNKTDEFSFYENGLFNLLAFRPFFYGL